MAKLVGTIHIDHAPEVERERGKASRVYLTFDRGLKGGKLDEATLTEAQVLDLIADAALILRTLRSRRGLA